MKQAALQALQHVRTTLAYQLTPEAVSELLRPIVEALAIFPDMAAHDAKVEVALHAVETLIEVEQSQRSGLVTLGALGRAYNLLEHSIRSLRL